MGKPPPLLVVALLSLALSSSFVGCYMFPLLNTICSPFLNSQRILGVNFSLQLMRAIFCPHLPLSLSSLGKHIMGCIIINRCQSYLMYPPLCLSQILSLTPLHSPLPPFGTGVLAIPLTPKLPLSQTYQNYLLTLTRVSPVLWPSSPSSHTLPVHPEPLTCSTLCISIFGVPTILLAEGNISTSLLLSMIIPVPLGSVS